SIVDGVASNNTDFDLRVTTSTDTLEYDDANNDTPFGAVSPNVAGTPVGGLPVYLRLNQFSATQVSEPYRVYAAIQPPSPAATPEVEPNNGPASATTGPRLYFSGALSGATDVDVFSFAASAGDLIVLGLDLDPTRDNTPWNGILALLDATGAALVT